MIRPLQIVAALALLAPNLIPADETWPAFRGPGRQGHAEGDLPLRWSTTDNVVWKATVPGTGWSSPIIGHGKVYLTGAIGGDLTDHKAKRTLAVMAFDLATGQPLWTRDIFEQGGAGTPKIHKKNSHASPTPVLEGNRLYVHFGHQGTAALNAEDGSIVWEKRDIQYAPVHGGGGSPMVWNHLLIFSCDGGDQRFIVALDKNTGEETWRTERHGEVKRTFSFTTPLVIEVDGTEELISSASGGCFAYDPATGKELWFADYGEGYSVIPRPVYGDGRVYIGSGYDSPSVLAIRPGGRGDVTETHVDWIVRKRAPHTPSLLFHDGLVYMVSDAGIASCLEADSGGVVWQERATGPISASPLLVDDRIYLQDEEGKSVVLKAGRRFEILAENDLGERSLASYGVAGNSLLIRTAGHLYRIAAER